MKKIFVDKIDNGTCVLSGDNHSHVSFSLRARIGDELVLCKDGIDYLGKIVKITKTETFLDIVSSNPCDTEANTDVTLFFGIMKGDKNELVAQKCTELGVKTIKPFVSSNCECRPGSVKIERINRIITEAAQQCGRGTLPLVTKVFNFDDVLDELKAFDIVVFAYERETDSGLKSIISNAGNKRIAVIVGSEGGFTEDEADRLIYYGAKSVTLGKRILRAETASIAVISAIMYEVNEWNIK